MKVTKLYPSIHSTIPDNKKSCKLQNCDTDTRYTLTQIVPLNISIDIVLVTFNVITSKIHFSNYWQYIFRNGSKMPVFLRLFRRTLAHRKRLYVCNEMHIIAVWTSHEKKCRNLVFFLGLILFYLAKDIILIIDLACMKIIVIMRHASEDKETGDYF